jgi:mannosyltransferase OCH1-like enzyme
MINKTMIPKIIHQTWKGQPDTLPPNWVDSYNTWKSLAQEYGFTYMYWDDKDIDKFIETYYPWFINKFRAYPHGIQRADTFRYFVLYHYGGLYSDFDNVPSREFFSQFWPQHQYHGIVFGLCKPGNSVGDQDITNAIMLSVPKHNLWVHVFTLLHDPCLINKWKSVGMHIYCFEVIFSTGPGIVSDAYHSAAPSLKRNVIVTDKLQTSSGPFISTIEGGIWYQGSMTSTIVGYAKQLKNKF